MDEHNARCTNWIGAIATIDADRAVLSDDTRRIAAQHAKAAGESLNADTMGKWLFNAVADKHPELRRLDTQLTMPKWPSVGIPVAALFLGLTADTLASSRRIDLLAIPVFTLLLWNLVIYALLVARQFHRCEGAGLLDWISARIASLGFEPRSGQTELWPRIRNEFVRTWQTASMPLLLERTKIIFHAAAIAAIAGVIAGMYLRGIAFEYRAGWGSTFLSAESMHALLATLLGPAAWVTGIPIPDAQHLKSISWHINPAGEKAGDWIHLYAATCALFIIAPRLMLGILSLTKLRQLRTDFPIDTSAFALPAQSVLADSDSPKARRICVIPFNLELTSRSRDLIRLYAFGEAGGPVNIDYREPIAYGDEERYFRQFDGGKKAPERYVIVFNLSSTPETEVQGIVARGLMTIAANHTPVSAPSVYVDGTAFMDRFGGEASYAHRLQDRKQTWTQFLKNYKIKPLFLNTDSNS